jgi:hypothetical protein
MARLRTIFFQSLSDDDFRDISVSLIQRAKVLGDLPWIREVLDRAIGKAPTAGTDSEEESYSP